MDRQTDRKTQERIPKDSTVKKYTCILRVNDKYEYEKQKTKATRKSTSTTEFFTTQSRLLTTLYKEPIENNVGKGENAGNQHFLLFPQCFLPFPKQISFF